jgi:hypothetical protein
LSQRIRLLDRGGDQRVVDPPALAHRDHRRGWIETNEVTLAGPAERGADETGTATDIQHGARGLAEPPHELARSLLHVADVLAAGRQLISACDRIIFSTRPIASSCW